jgi:aspartyl/asparaginyl beta-hydroxylase (cupin superfamily)
MEPHSDIVTHTDNTNFVVTSHLALDIPYSGENKCRLTIGDETRQWINGEICMFDTSILHSAINESDKTRYIFNVTIVASNLTEVERQAIHFLYDALQVPELVSLNPKERFRAEQYVETTMRAFPEIKPLAAEAVGFGAKKMEKKKKKKG